jgi:hypothetical protein
VDRIGPFIRQMVDLRCASLHQELSIGESEGSEAKLRW